MDEKILNRLLDYAREYMGAEIPFNNKWIIENFLIAERIKLSEQQSNCNLPHVMPTLPDYGAIEMATWDYYTSHNGYNEITDEETYHKVMDYLEHNLAYIQGTKGN